MSAECLWYLPALLASALLVACATPLQPREPLESPLPPPASANETFVNNTLPSPRFIRMREYYPNALRMQGRAGQVLLAYSVNDAGAAERVEVLRSDDAAFSRGAAAFLADERFSVPSDWDAEKGPQLRYEVEVQFTLHGMPRLETWDLQATVATITGTSPDYP